MPMYGRVGRWGDVLPLMQAADVMILPLETAATTADTLAEQALFARHRCGVEGVA